MPFSNGSPESMDGISRTLDYFASISGLGIIFSKTKLVWIGSKKFSKQIFHHTRWKIDRESSNFDLLWIKFSIHLQEMIDLNYRPIFIKERNIINQWKQRKLTPIGRLVLIKTLIIPRLNDLSLTLPNPSKESRSILLV